MSVVFQQELPTVFPRLLLSLLSLFGAINLHHRQSLSCPHAALNTHPSNTLIIWTFPNYSACFSLCVAQPSRWKARSPRSWPIRLTKCRSPTLCPPPPRCLLTQLQTPQSHCPQYLFTIAEAAELSLLEIGPSVGTPSAANARGGDAHPRICEPQSGREHRAKITLKITFIFLYPLAGENILG